MGIKFKAAFGLVLFVGFAAVAYRASVFRISQNFAVVEPNKLYRSAQLTTAELEQTIQNYGIKTVISLRGTPLATSFYEQQDIALRRLHTNFIPIDMSEKYYPDEKVLRQILSAFEKSEYPILIHCRAGSDRTGLVAALYQQIYMHKSADESLEQLTFTNWHVPLFKPAMKDFAKKFKNRDWAMNDYSVCLPEFAEYRESTHDCKN